jgi:alkanesulfonate monooxygenase SsuD/methylene tetrahydromethanopterin reductase-like flavin-dependent oxidoreductase (luciferase family)
MEAAGADMKLRGVRADEFIQVLKTIWTTDPAEYHGKFFSLPKSHIGPKPVQKPHPPIYIAAFAPAALKRVATTADGWNSNRSSRCRHRAHVRGDTADGARSGTRSDGAEDDRAREPGPQGKAVEKDRAIFMGTPDQIREDIAACEKIGAEEVFPGTGVHTRWAAAEQLGETAGGVSAAKVNWLSARWREEGRWKYSRTPARPLNIFARLFRINGLGGLVASC